MAVVVVVVVRAPGVAPLGVQLRPGRLAVVPRGGGEAVGGGAVVGGRDGGAVAAEEAGGARGCAAYRGQGRGVSRKAYAYATSSQLDL